ncbi:histone-lysine N-methyltransferase SETMAR-like [Harpegnathos saltator]|uniref:histone-lysine N-methyltransferase SETMAR-like n=1 Tax=Harpegnathos saltator TaxID=610380 RepID=UPI000DBED750|nr:histone-lysine N-methyltransferase SETMAR-like [Harpegnathos saltator]
MRIIFLYEYKLDHSAAEATRNINTAFGEGSVSDRTIRRWFEKFRSGDTNLDNLPRGHAPSVIDDNVLKDVVEADSRLSVRDIAHSINVHYSTVSRHLKAMGKVKKFDKWVPHELTERHKLRRMEINSSLLSRHNNEGILNRIVTCDEKWVLYDNRRRSAQWLDADQAPKHMPKPSLHPRKVMVSVWWSAKSIVHFSFFKKGETINTDKYCQEIDIVMEKLRIEQPALLNRRESDVKNAFNEFLASRSSNFYVKGIDALVSRWGKCIEVEGDYFD